MKPPPELFSQSVVLCPSCGHGIDPHGVDPGGPCGVGDRTWKGEHQFGLCPCMWSPNDIAWTLIFEEMNRPPHTIKLEGDNLPGLVAVSKRTAAHELAGMLRARGEQSGSYRGTWELAAFMAWDYGQRVGNG